MQSDYTQNRHRMALKRAMRYDHRAEALGRYTHIAATCPRRAVQPQAVLQPLLDQLIAAGFHVEPQGQVYREALQRVGED